MKKTVQIADQLIRDILKHLPARCCCCETPYGLEVGHWITRSFKGTRWDLRNLHRQCRSCNSEHEYNTESMDTFMENYDTEELKQLSRIITKKYAVQEKIVVLKEILAKLESGEFTTRQEVEDYQRNS